MSIKSAAHLADAPKLGEAKCKRRRVNRAQRVGDADNTGTIAGMLSGALYGLEAISDAWRNTLMQASAARVRPRRGH
ncbi:MAG: hypothetical protein Q7T38_02275 [Gallionella sp.]|nr:hypothetical protein [Gallionella sp.]